MEKTLKFIFKHLPKYLPWILLVIGAVIAFQFFNCQGTENERLSTYNRQLQGQLTAKETELQTAHNEIGVSNSKLVKQSELMEQLKKDNEELDKEFNAFREKHNLQIKSRDRTIASLKQKITDGKTEIIVNGSCEDIGKNCAIGYNWEDTLGRFKLKDPNIFESGNETFESNQLFKVYGEVWEQKDGSLQTRRLVLREMYQNENGDYIPIPEGKAEIVDSEFTYHNPPPVETEWEWTDLFTLRPIFIGSVKIFPDLGATEFGIGMEIIGYEAIGLGLNTHTSFNFNNPEQIGQYIGISYSPKFFDFRLNLGLSFSVGMPFIKFGSAVGVKAGLIFYLW